MPWDDDLTPEQRQYASHPARVLRLVAGPGTGKTRVLTRRVAYLIESGAAEPSAILALTFSRAAARELRQRLELLEGVDVGDRPSVYTLHAFALRQLLLLGGAPILPHPIRIADDYDERWVIEEELSELAGLSVREVRREFQNLASDWETLRADEDEWERRHPNPRFLGAWRRHRQIYGYTLRAELVYALKKAFDEDADLVLEDDFTHVLADEYQDLNRCEIAVLRRLVGDDRSFFAAGDDDQSIYGFRNAFPLGLREFDQTYPGAEDGELEECHRCDRTVLAMGLNVAEQDVDRIPKALRHRDDAEEGRVEALGFRDGEHEARGIARLCKQLVEEEGLEPGQILILLRSDPQGVYSGPIIDALAESGIAAELPANPFAVLDEPTPRQLVCILRLLRDREHGLAWRELLKLRSNGVGDGALLALYRLADERGERYDRTLQVVAADPNALDHPMRTRVASDVRALNDLLDELAEVLDADAQSGLQTVLDAVGFPDEERAEIVELLEGLLVQEGDQGSTLRDLETALHSSRGAMDEAERAGDPERVQIMSMHSAKGLTSDAVIVAACEDELIPGETSDRRELDDQRRLLYVSLTRARHFLFVTYARRRPGRQSHLLQVPVARTYTTFLRDYLPPRQVA
ncbi:MAG: ATP-dependent helicase [Thermoleophilia bacterium]